MSNIEGFFKNSLSQFEDYSFRSFEDVVLWAGAGVGVGVGAEAWAEAWAEGAGDGCGGGGGGVNCWSGIETPCPSYVLLHVF